MRSFLGKAWANAIFLTSEVHRARSRKTNELVALKKIIMHHEKDGFPITALREIRLLKLLSHQNVVQLEDMAVEHSQRQSPCPPTSPAQIRTRLTTPQQPKSGGSRSCTW